MGISANGNEDARASHSFDKFGLKSVLYTPLIRL
jgi:hypothetical protein